MSLVASCQIPPTSFLDSFQSSFSRFHGYRLQMFRYLPSNPSRKHLPPLIQTTLNPNSHQKKPTPSSTFEPQKGQNAKRNQSLHVETSVPQSQHWIDGWSKTQLQNLPKRPQSLRDYQNVDDPSEEEEEEEEDNEISPRSSSTMDRIVEKLKRYGYVDGVNDSKAAPPERGSVEDIFYVEEGTLPNSRGGFSSESPLGMHTGFGDGQEEVRFPWEKKPVKEEGDAMNSLSRNRSKTYLAELTLPESELRRLRHSAIRTKERTKIRGAGVTQEIVDKIHEKWKSMEVVRLKCEGAPALNMKRMHEILERKSGGLVIWRSGTSISLYRGVGYELPSMQSSKKQLKRVPEIGFDSLGKGTHMASMDLRGKSLDGNIMWEAHESSKAIIEVKSKPYPLPDIDYDSEMDKLLDGLGPRYNDWPGDDLLPVDADLLPGVVPGYKAPFRILPYGVRPTLSNKDMTALRRLARVLPPHFALGRSRQHQGLAMAMVKLWERSSVAKIALKRGVQLTTSERMAEDIKKLTGATLLTRNKDYIVFYRGKDFLSPELTEALMERERLAKTLQDEEEQARLRASSSVVSNIETIELSGPAGTLAETLEADARWGKRLDDEDRDKILRSAEAARHADLVRKLEKKLYLANRKLMKAEKALNKVEEFLKPAERPADPESVSDEERFMFRKLGLRMKAFLLLGRRGVFDGTVENMHLHWKYRELVKIIVNEKNFAEVKKVALSLESESGGVLISVDKISKGYAIIVFRGQDYKRPPILRPKNLLTKRKALARSIELQRHEALSNHISTLHKKAGQLRAELDQMETVKGQGDDELYAKLDSTYPNEDEDTEDEGDEAYLETYNHDDDEDDFQLGSLVDENDESSSNM